MTADERTYLMLFTPRTYSVELPRDLAKSMEAARGLNSPTKTGNLLTMGHDAPNSGQFKEGHSGAPRARRPVSKLIWPS
jgi:hypothetical protein